MSLKEELFCLCGCGKTLDNKNIITLQIVEVNEGKFSTLLLIFRKECFERIRKRFYMILGELKVK